ncbi:hypothetical protein EYF80_008929 [Liparis tanakae]|uniref:Uncharacterized protein n=1 Tax=Liparis tanakae TaxID=230148 RepID=A0A4Z2ITQ7_9TELE|nr:hypothetical protein EYF80_008929 [Liparis tanakae]
MRRVARVALGDTGGEVGAGAGGKARLHVIMATVQGWVGEDIRVGGPFEHTVQGLQLLLGEGVCSQSSTGLHPGRRETSSEVTSTCAQHTAARATADFIHTASSQHQQYKNKNCAMRCLFTVVKCSTQESSRLTGDQSLLIGTPG